MPSLVVTKGGLRFEFVAEGLKSMQELIKQAAFVSEWPDHCPICEASIFLTFRSPSGNDYYGLQCNGSPAHEVNLHERKEASGGGMYYKPEEWTTAYKDRNKDGGGSSTPATAQSTSQAPATATAPSAPASTVSDTGPAMNATKARVIQSIAAQKSADIEVIATSMCGKPFAQCNDKDGDTILAALNSL